MKTKIKITISKCKRCGKEIKSTRGKKEYCTKCDMELFPENWSTLPDIFSITE